MSKEEKKAIELMEICMYGTEESTIIKNLINKQQKEIEALEIIHNTYKEMIEENNYISKDKIRELREIDNIDLIQFKIKKLLEEK